MCILVYICACQGSCKRWPDVKTTCQRRSATLIVAFSSNSQMNKALCLSQSVCLCVFFSMSTTSLSLLLLLPHCLLLSFSLFLSRCICFSASLTNFLNQLSSLSLLKILHAIFAFSVYIFFSFSSLVVPSLHLSCV